MSILSNTIKVNFPKVKNLSLIVLFLELIKNKTCWFNEERVFFFFFFHVFRCCCKLSNKNTISPRRIMVLCCIANFEQF